MKKLKVLDLFCGCGGISLGFELAGYEIFGGIDVNQDAVNTMMIYLIYLEIYKK